MCLKISKIAEHAECSQSMSVVIVQCASKVFWESWLNKVMGAWVGWYEEVFEQVRLQGVRMRKSG